MLNPVVTAVFEFMRFMRAVVGGEVTKLQALFTGDDLELNSVYEVVEARLEAVCKTFSLFL